ncbi:MarC family protein [Candidatus Finniella inopinata]|uniref:UPF0056 membrane protein n=1 Tax=Candidatus Finniella inopinata TaxID=1696036 RepID=A0A4Q7DKN4_9PROT|nr:MarC family protein [Candidatus Finniella inopinata]RZI46950.1 MarC family protein [Candidatus Finniella inopinata]
MNDFLWQAFVTLLVVIDPFAVVPVYIGLTHKKSPDKRRRIAQKSCFIGLVLLLAFAFLGDQLLNALNISEPAFRIAGGFLLLLASIEMVMGKTVGLRASTGDEEAEKHEDVSVFPLAIPLLAGPGALTSIVILMRQAQARSFLTSLAVSLLAVLVLGITYISFRLSDRIMKVLGLTGTNVLTRVFGIILAALAIQNMITGVIAVLRAV